MRQRGCAYRGGLRGRSFSTRPGVGGPSCHAHLACATCGTSGALVARSDATPRQLDDKFRKAGWLLDPHCCPDCRSNLTKEKPMATKPSAAAMKAQATMFRHLSERFDADAGRFEAGWTDQRIASETGLAVDVVVEFRRAGFGEIKEEPEIAALRADIRSLEQLQREHNDTVVREIAALRGRVLKLTGAAA